MTGFELRQTVAAMPIHGCYAQYVCVPQRKLVPVPAGLDAAEAVAVVLNYITAYQMLHRSAKARPGQRMLIHGASGGVGSAMLQLAKLAGVEMYGTCSAQGATVVRELGSIPIDYKNADFVKEIQRLTGERTGVEPRSVRLLSTETGRVVFLTVGVGSAASLVEAHQLASELEEQLRQQLPDIADVVVHTEP